MIKWLPSPWLPLLWLPKLDSFGVKKAYVLGRMEKWLTSDDLNWFSEWVGGASLLDAGWGTLELGWASNLAASGWWLVGLSFTTKVFPGSLLWADVGGGSGGILYWRCLCIVVFIALAGCGDLEFLGAGGVIGRALKWRVMHLFGEVGVLHWLSFLFCVLGS